MHDRPLDLFALYKNVCRRGGYQVANAIDWRGEVYKSLRKCVDGKEGTPMVANILKLQYQTLLVGYEEAHPADVMRGQPEEGAELMDMS